MTQQTITNPLGTEPVGQLLKKFAIPSIIAMLVGSLYNMVDQLFIGNFVGSLGNGATNIQFPLSMYQSHFYAVSELHPILIFH